MKKRPLLILSGTVMGTVGVLSFVPMATNATSLSAISASPTASPLATNAPANTKSTAKSTATASSSVVATSKTGSTSIRKITGDIIQTQFGPVQVQITVKGMKIVGATALQTPQGGRSSMINQQAVPYLVQETLATQSANIQGVSGATYTSDAWAQSLQSALSKI